MAHTQKKVEPLVEVVGLLSNLLEAWKAIENKSSAELDRSTNQSLIPAKLPVSEEENPVAYGGYFGEARSGSILGESYSF